ncbi:MAG: glycosyltransferase [Oscillospiraceae bacterium]|nr:glycosyltransferase [Oscillospiraceae bacterium]
MKQSLKVSIVMPCYNVEKYVIEAIESVINQTLTDIEIICVNDGSTDNTPAILEQYAQKDERITIINQANQGLSAARNAGFFHATGEYVYFFDSDDILELNAMECLYDRASSTNSQIVMFNASVIYENKELQSKFSGFQQGVCANLDLPDVYKGDDFLCMIPEETILRLDAWRLLIERKYLLDHGLTFKVGILHESVLFSPQALLLCQRVSFINEKLIRYRIRENSIMTRPYHFARLQGAHHVLVGLLAFLTKHEASINSAAMNVMKGRLLWLQQYLGGQKLPVDEMVMPRYEEPLLDLWSELLWRSYVWKMEADESAK